MGTFLREASLDRQHTQDIADTIKEVITPNSIAETILQLQVPSPSGTINKTMMPIVIQALGRASFFGKRITPNFFSSESPGFTVGNGNDVLFMAHSDKISYALKTIHPDNEDRFELTALCAHGVEQDLQFAAEVIRYNYQTGNYESVAQGVIGTHSKDEKSSSSPYYKGEVPNGGFITGIDRIVFSSQFSYNQDSGYLTGHIDNVAGMSSIIAMLAFVEKALEKKLLNKSLLHFSVVFPDGEEGPPGASAFFVRNSRRMFHHMERHQLPQWVVNIDGHNTPELQKAALLGSIVSEGKGEIVAPHDYATFWHFLNLLSQFGIHVIPTDLVGTISRSDGSAAMEVHSRVIPFGYSARNYHYNQGLPEMYIDTVVNNARALAWIVSSSAITVDLPKR